MSEKEKPKKIATYQTTFDDYHKQIREIIVSNTETPQKIGNLELAIFPFHSIVKQRYSQEYKNKATEIIKKLKDDIKYSAHTNEPSRKERLSLLTEWFSLILESEPRFTLDKNLQRVKFE